MMQSTAKAVGWTLTGAMATLVLPAVIAVLPNMRKRYGIAPFSLPSMMLMGGLWLWQRGMEKRSVVNQSSASPLPR